MKILIGGSPCTHWSIAQKNNRETEPKGLGWELFKNYLIAKEKFKPDLFLYENNKSAAQTIKDQIAKELGVGVDPDVRFTYINSALVSAQNRQRFYVTNFGDIEQPEDRGILLKDVLQTGEPRYEKSPCIDANYYKGGNLTRPGCQSGQRLMACKPVCMRYERDETAKRLRKQYEAGEVTHGFREHSELHPRLDGKTNTLSTVLKDNPIMEPVCVAQRGRYTDTGNRTAKGNGPVEQFYEAREDGKTNTLTTVQKDNYVAEPVAESQTVQKAIPEIVEKLGYVPEMFNAYNRQEITDKSPTLSTGSMVTSSCATNRFEAIPGYATPCEWDENGKPTKAISGADGKVYTVYEVKDGLITIKDKQYPIKLTDGYYIIRKLTVRECARLQTLPDDYCKAVSDSQAYKALGNGWTAEVIIHLLNHALKDVPRDEEIVVLSMYDGIATGRYCLDKMGFTNITYHAYEIDPYPIKIAMDNYPDIIQCGDAFAVRANNWHL